MVKHDSVISNLLLLIDYPERCPQRVLTADTLYDSVAAFQTVDKIPKAHVWIERVFLAETKSETPSLR